MGARRRLSRLTRRDDERVKSITTVGHRKRVIVFILLRVCTTSLASQLTSNVKAPSCRERVIKQILHTSCAGQIVGHRAFA